MAESIFRGTTICAVRKNGECAMAGDGQVTMGQQTVMKAHAHKVRRIYNGKVVVGFAGSVADAFALSEKFEEKLTQRGRFCRTPTCPPARSPSAP